MSLRTKIQALIEKAKFGNIYLKIVKNEPLDLIIPDGITELFENNNIFAPLSTVTAIGADIEKILYSTFSSTNIKKIEFPKLQIVEEIAFSHCHALTDINAPALTTIGDSAFEDCTALTDINAPALSSIGNSAFAGCTALTEINAPALTTIGENAILGTKLTKMTVGVLASTTTKSFVQVSRGSGNLAELYVGAGTSADLYLQNSTKYTQPVLHGIIENLADRTGLTAGVFSVGTTNLQKIDDAHKTMLENRNWIYK